MFAIAHHPLQTRITRAALCTVAVLTVAVSSAAPGGGETWTSAGYDAQNTRYNKTESAIGANNVRRLVTEMETGHGWRCVRHTCGGRYVRLRARLRRQFLCSRSSDRHRALAGQHWEPYGHPGRSRPGDTGHQRRSAHLRRPGRAKPFRRTGGYWPSRKNQGLLPGRRNFRAASRSLRRRQWYMATWPMSDLRPLKRRWFALAFH